MRIKPNVPLWLRLRMEAYARAAAIATSQAHQQFMRTQREIKKKGLICPHGYALNPVMGNEFHCPQCLPPEDAPF